MAPVNVNKIQLWINKGRLDPSQPITVKELRDSGCVTSVQDGVKLLADGAGELITPIDIVVSRASSQAIEAIEKVGGRVWTRHYTPFALRKIADGLMDPIHSPMSRIPLQSPKTAAEYRYQLPDATSRKEIEYYRDTAHRGYLTWTVKAYESPSLYFRTPGFNKRNKTVLPGGESVTKVEAENRLW